MAKLFDVVGKIGEGTYGVVYLARSREPRPCLLAVKTFKPGKARLPSLRCWPARNGCRPFVAALPAGRQDIHARQSVPFSEP